jgi:hypothetical protein
MIIVNIKGGLGNQMFQYALAHCIAKEKNTLVTCDLRYLNERKGEKNYVIRNFDLGIFGIASKEPSKMALLRVGMLFGGYKARYLLGKALDRLGFLVISERHSSFDSRVFKRNSSEIYLDGYWQTEKYFKNHESEIRNLYRIDTSNFSEITIALAEKILSDQNAVCINVRRGDFIGSKNHDVTGIEYFEKALNRIRKNISEPNVYIFSDDVEWCDKKLSKISNNVIIVGHEYAGKYFEEYLYLMTLFEYYIIPNSTFAWWAAWLCARAQKIVIAPKTWSGLDHLNNLDIVPNSWIRI